MILIAGAIGGFMLGMNRDVASSIWGMTGATLAAWIQAIGSLAGIAIAIWVPYSIHNREQKRAAAEAAFALKLIATRLMTPVATIFHQAEALKSPLVKPTNVPSYDWIQQHGPPRELSSVQALAKHWDDLRALPDPVASRLAALMSVADGYNDRTGAMRFSPLSHENVQLFDREHPGWFQCLVEIRTLACESFNLMCECAAVSGIAHLVDDRVSPPAKLR